ncbi:MAG: Unknown protein [uncultured Sulfurovum sp.]|uniref:Outer membrane porin, OprD family n=1 Tax=uncultured Sulfurovum sp. TaxID=269237 RepID=A0A6S6U5J9_9BACT|nr:MAG: Unknown protein [uncultured Sulfurovum sp.]
MSKEEKRILNANSTVNVLQMPKEVDTLTEVLTEGMFYGRFRLNAFSFDWDEEVEGKTGDHQTLGVGGSIHYKSAYLNGVGFTAGLYTSQNPWHMDKETLKYYKVGKGVLNRHDVMTKNKYGMTNLAVAYLELKDEKNSVKIGRQIVESYLTKSNDIKMIPNTFEGITWVSKNIGEHKLWTGYLLKQKLRDHNDFHHLFAYDDGVGAYDKWRQNDDTAMHRGITLSKLNEKGIKDRLIFMEFSNAKKNDFNYITSYTLVPELFSTFGTDLTYKYRTKNGYLLSPSVRYMHQFDHGAGVMGGANLKTNNVAYFNVDSVETDLYGIRFDVGKERWRVRSGISKIADKADIISPWRSFPTNSYGYTLLQYNWYANTTSYVVQGDYDFKEQNLHAQMRFGIQDFDDDKSGVQADSNVLQLDFIKQFEDYKNLYTKLRMVRVLGDENTIALDGKKKLNPSYTDIRFEVNYLF